MTKLNSQLSKVYPFKNNYFSVDGYNYHYVDEGEGTPIIMLHGNPSWSFLFRTLVSHFKLNYRVIVPDHLGSGLSDKPEDYDYCLENHTNNLKALIKHLNIESFHLLVHDWGGPIGLNMATDEPERIKRLVITNTCAFHLSKLPLRIQVCRIPLLGDLLVRGMNAFARAATHMAVVQKLSKDVRQGYTFPYDSWANRVGHSGFLKDIPLKDGDKSYPIITKIEKNLSLLEDKDILILWGDKDFCFTLEFFNRWKKIFPKAKYRQFHNAGHYLFEDAAQDILMELDPFFKD